MYTKYATAFLLCLYAGFSVSAQVCVNEDGNIEATIYHPAYRQYKVSPTLLPSKNVVPFVPEEFIICPEKEKPKSLTGQAYTTYWRFNSFLSYFRHNRMAHAKDRDLIKKQLNYTYLKSDKTTKDYIQHTDAQQANIQHALQHDDVVDAALAFFTVVACDQHLLTPVCEEPN